MVSFPVRVQLAGVDMCISTVKKFQGKKEQNTFFCIRVDPKNQQKIDLH